MLRIPCWTLPWIRRRGRGTEVNRMPVLQACAWYPEMSATCDYRTLNPGLH